MNVDMDFGAKNPSGVGDWQLNNPSSTQYAAPSTTLFQTQDGYASGYLQRVTIDPDGTLTGTYSNGVNMDRYQIGLAIFRNQWGLEKKGDNLYSENRDSGLPTINTPGTGGAGTLSPNSLEQSNVDLAEEFVDMIVQQRGFQANSKVITTTDTMLAELINLKR
jgi:flagellar hook protein FlgE